MSNKLEGKKISVLVETEFIYDELMYYKNYFSSRGAEVHFISYLWGEKEKTFVSDIDSPNKPIHTIEVSICVTQVNTTDYDAILMAANYCAVRLREVVAEKPGKDGKPTYAKFGSIEKIPTPPAVTFYAEAMENESIVKGALCHGLWILTPNPQLLTGRKVICHTVVLADIHNAGAIYVPESVVTDDDLVTGRSSGNVAEYCHAIADNMLKRVTSN